MRLFELFGKDRIAPAWEYEAHHQLWHVRPTDVGVIVGVERDPVTKETAFFCVAADTGRGVRLGIVRLELAGTAVMEDDDHRFDRGEAGLRR